MTIHKPSAAERGASVWYYDKWGALIECDATPPAPLAFTVNATIVGDASRFIGAIERAYSRRWPWMAVLLTLAIMGVAILCQ
ncbi:MAG: hypothetical protein GY832_26315 [Chloroflexi bacterium]|nr:hypothetical protein [Chloroflexota bacterium]